MASRAWELFVPYLFVKNFREGLENIIELEGRIVGIQLFNTLDILLEAHELTLPPVVPSTTVIADQTAPLIEVVNRKEDAGDPPLTNVQAFFPFGMRVDHNIPGCVKLYRRIIEKLADFGEHKFLLRDRELALQAHLLQFIQLIVKIQRNEVSR